MVEGDYCGLPRYGAQYLARVEMFKMLVRTRQISPLELNIDEAEIPIATLGRSCFFCQYPIIGKVYTLEMEKLILGNPVKVFYSFDEVCLAEARKFTQLGLMFPN